MISVEMITRFFLRLKNDKAFTEAVAQIYKEIFSKGARLIYNEDIFMIFAWECFRHLEADGSLDFVDKLG